MDQSLKSDLKFAFKDIKNGFSKIKVFENLFYLKHMSFDDQLDIDFAYKEFYDKAISRGLPTQKQTIEQLIEEKQWSAKEERQITEQEKFIADLVKQKKAIYLKSEIQRINKDIEEATKKLLVLKNQKVNLMSRTAESYAEEKVNDLYILKCLYKDKHFESPAYSEEEFDSIESDMLFEIIKNYNLVYKNINDDTIQKIVLQDFFNLYMPFTDNVYDFYGKSLVELSYNQLKLVIYARFFKNIFQNNDKMPEDIKSDPDKIIDYVNANENAKKSIERKNNKENSAQSIVGATREDLEYLNVVKPGQKTLSLAEEAKKKGGSLSMDDMMKLFG